jgi:flagellar biosynthesis GTPase FlhF
VRIKSYFTTTVESAVILARNELGEEALLVSARRSPPNSPKGSHYEVVFAFNQEPQKGTPVETALVSKSSFKHPVTSLPAAPEHGSEHPNSGMIAEIAARVTVSDTLGRAGVEAAKVALVGPCGAGKTSMIVKLAVRYGLLAGRRTTLISVDADRVACTEPLRSYARLLGFPFTALDDAADLHDVLCRCAEGDLVLIDTPGFDQSTIREATTLAQFLTPEAGIDTHLVVPASLQPRVLQAVVDRFQIFGFAKMLFTRLDEADSLAGVFLEAARTRKPLSFWSIGPDIPDAFERASKSTLMERLLGPRSLVASAK